MREHSSKLQEGGGADGWLVYSEDPKIPCPPIRVVPLQQLSEERLVVVRIAAGAGGRCMDKHMANAISGALELSSLFCVVMIRSAKAIAFAGAILDAAGYAQHSTAQNNQSAGQHSVDLDESDSATVPFHRPMWLTCTSESPTHTALLQPEIPAFRGEGMGEFHDERHQVSGPGPQVKRWPFTWFVTVQFSRNGPALAAHRWLGPNGSFSIWAKPEDEQSVMVPTAPCYTCRVPDIHPGVVIPCWDTHTHTYTTHIHRSVPMRGDAYHTP